MCVDGRGRGGPASPGPSARSSRPSRPAGRQARRQRAPVHLPRRRGPRRPGALARSGACREYAPTMLRLARETRAGPWSGSPRTRASARPASPRRARRPAYALDVDAPVSGAAGCASGSTGCPPPATTSARTPPSGCSPRCARWLDELAGGRTLPAATSTVSASPVQHELLATRRRLLHCGSSDSCQFGLRARLALRPSTSCPGSGWQSVFDRARYRAAFDHGLLTAVTIHDWIVPEVVRVTARAPGPTLLRGRPAARARPAVPRPPADHAARRSRDDARRARPRVLPHLPPGADRHLERAPARRRFLPAPTWRTARCPAATGARTSATARWLEAQDLAAARDFWLRRTAPDGLRVGARHRVTGRLRRPVRTRARLHLRRGRPALTHCQPARWAR